MHVVQQHKACLQKQFKTQKWFRTPFRVVTTTLGTNRYIGGHIEEVLYKSVNSQITILEKCHRTPAGWLVVVIAACKSKNIKTHIVKDINLLSVNVDIFENHIWCNMAETIMASIRRCIHTTRNNKSSKPFLVAGRKSNYNCADYSCIEIGRENEFLLDSQSTNGDFSNQRVVQKDSSVIDIKTLRQVENFLVGKRCCSGQERVRKNT